MRRLLFVLPLLLVGCGLYSWLLGIPDPVTGAPPVGPPDGTPGVPFYQDFKFWAWAVGGGATAVHALLKEGIPKIPTIPFTPAHRRRRRRKQAIAPASPPQA